MAQNKNLHSAKKAKNDEFYTQLTDIEKEMVHYTEHFKGKTIICNCDDPRVSNFVKHFVLKFKVYGLKRLIATCYKNNEPDLFSVGNSEQAVYIDYDGSAEINSIEEFGKIPVYPLQGDGDFRSDECIELLKQADIAITNPPFSLFREYIDQLMEYDKKFIIVGNINAITYKEFFPLIKDNKVWVGFKFNGSPMIFGVPDDYPLKGSITKIENGKKYIGVGGTCWFTNLDFPKRHESLFLYKKYTPEEYPKYDNYDAINVNKTADIPVDYDGVMGVPISFLDKYSPEQFIIIGLDRYLKDNPNYGHRFTVEGRETYARIIIQKKQEQSSALANERFNLQY